MILRTKNFTGAAVARLPYVGRGKIGTVVAIALSSLCFIPAAAFALSERELYILCSRYPRNSNCEEYEVPIALSQREGTSGECKLHSEASSLRGRCKVDVSEDRVVAYIETGDKPSLLEGEQSTKTVTVEVGAISDLSHATDLPPLNAAELNVARFLQIVGMGMQVAGGSIPNSYEPIGNDSTASQLTMQFLPAGEQTSAQPIEESMEAFVEANGSEVSLEDEQSLNAESDSRIIYNSSLRFKSSPQRERQVRESIQQVTGLSSSANQSVENTEGS